MAGTIAEVKENSL